MESARARVGRRRSTSWEHISDVAIDLFMTHGFDDVSVDDVAAAAGIARRTLFRYYPSKNALPWGDFDAYLDRMRGLLAESDPRAPVHVALRTALLAFNDFDDTDRHRQRMRVILETEALQAYSMTMYAGWRAVVASFVAGRLQVSASDLVPQTVAWTMLAVALTAYEQWLANTSVSLAAALGDAFDLLAGGLASLESGVSEFGRDGDDKGVSAEPDGDNAPRTLLALYDEALPAVYGYFVRRCSDRGTAEDLTSETFLAAMDAARKPTPPLLTVPWLIGVARHKLADHYRRRHDRFSVPVSEPPEPGEPHDTWDGEVDRIVAEQVLARLSEQHRTVLALRYMDGCTVGECADLIGRTVHATEALLVRARRAFRQQYPHREGGMP